MAVNCLPPYEQGVDPAFTKRGRSGRVFGGEGVLADLKSNRICIVYDGTKGYCQRFVRELAPLLEQRAFLVDTHSIEQGPLHTADYVGLIVGCPVLGLGMRHQAPGPKMTRYLSELSNLEGLPVGLFCVYATRAGGVLGRMRSLLGRNGAEVVVEQAIWRGAPGREAHVIPTECMVRMR